CASSGSNPAIGRPSKGPAERLLRPERQRGVRFERRIRFVQAHR
ncbi:MAG: hypothetical protein AVDCRST_MAG59-1062, partial [uncultured Thermomicrobiales bacterium]